MIRQLTSAIAQAFGENKIEWSTASQLSRRFGGSRDHVKRVVDKLVLDGLAIKREGKRGSEYKSLEKP